jgi:hypothetical protein
MTVTQFRRTALSMPQAVEASHMGHPDFRVRGKIFATLFTRDGVDCGMVKLTPAEQRRFVESRPQVFAPIRGGWGKRGCTQVHLDAAGREAVEDVRSALLTAWLNAAPEELVNDLDSAKSRNRRGRR